MQKKWLHRIGLITLATTLIVSNAQVTHATDSGDEWEINSDVETKWEQENEQKGPSFINGELSERKVTKEADVRKFLLENKELFKINSETKLDFIESNVDDIGMTHYIYKPKIQNIPIDNSKIVVHVNKDKKITAINGEFHPNAPEKLTEKQKLTKQQAIHNAWKHIDIKRSEADKKMASLTGETFNTLEETADLVVYHDDNKQYTLAYRVELQFAKPEPAYWNIWVNAESGEVLKAINQAQEISSTGSGIGVLGHERQLNTFYHQGDYYLYDTTKRMNGVIETFTNQGRGDRNLPGVYVKDEDNRFTNGEQQAAVDAHYHAGQVFDYYYNTFGRVSYDDNGSTIRSIVDYGNNYNNAAWLGDKIIYGNGDGRSFAPLSGANDIVAHELTHGVIDETADLVYANQSGALNESFADVFAYFVDGDWLIGEDVYTPGIEGDALRSLANPTRYNQPDHMNDYQHLPNTRDGDWGGVHINSGIPNKAAYFTVHGIGVSKAEQVYYRALTTYLTPNSSFQDARQALVQSAQDLYGESAAQEVARAWDRVGVN